MLIKKCLFFFFDNTWGNIRTLKFSSSQSRCGVSVPPMYFFLVQGFFFYTWGNIRTLKFSSSQSRCGVSIPPMYFFLVQGVLFIVSLGTAALLCRKHTSCGTFRSS